MKVNFSLLQKKYFMEDSLLTCKISCSGGASRWWKSNTWRSPSSPQIHQKYIYMWNNSYRTATECWQKTSDLPKGKKLPTYLGNRHPQATYMQRQGQIQTWNPGAVRTKKRKGNFSQQPQEQQIKFPQSTWCTLHLRNTWIHNKSSQSEEVDFGSTDRYRFFFPFSLFVSVYVYASVCDFVWIALLLPIVLGFSLSVFLLFLFVLV